MSSQIARANAGRVATSHSLARPACSVVRRHRVPGVCLPKSGHGYARRADSVVVKAQEKEEVDFDKLLIILATKWEEADNKGLVIGYSAAAVSALFVMEWLIHLPVLDILLGFPIQLVGLCVCPLLGVRWLVDKKDWFEDVSAATGTVVDVLPGLKKPASE